LIGNNGATEKDKGIPSDSLVGKTAAVITFDLHGKTFGGGDDEASVVFIQNGDWRAANLIANGRQNGLNGLQTITIPLSAFHKVGNSSIILGPNQPVSNHMPDSGIADHLLLISPVSKLLAKAGASQLRRTPPHQPPQTRLPNANQYAHANADTIGWLDRTLRGYCKSLLSRIETQARLRNPW
jgi:hypothetical protein